MTDPFLARNLCTHGICDLLLVEWQPEKAQKLCSCFVSGGEPPNQELGA